MGKSTISMAIFNSYVTKYQRVQWESTCQPSTMEISWDLAPIFCAPLGDDYTLTAAVRSLQVIQIVYIYIYYCNIYIYHDIYIYHKSQTLDSQRRPTTNERTNAWGSLHTFVTWKLRWCSQKMPKEVTSSQHMVVAEIFKSGFIKPPQKCHPKWSYSPSF